MEAYLLMNAVRDNWDFMSPETQILIATDAAGEGINLQFCRLLINWDIPGTLIA